MIAKHPVLIVALCLAIAWYFLVGAIDRGLLARQSSISMPCLTEHLPRGTIHTPEGAPFLPRGEYSYFPLGLGCTFTMNNGTTQSSFHPRYSQIALGAFPLAGILAGVTVRALATRNRPTVTQTES